MRLVRFLGAGFATALLDNGIFFVMHRATGARPLSFAVATIFSLAFNYVVVRMFIFEAKVPHSSTLPKYLAVHGTGMAVRFGIFEGLIAVFHIAPKHWGVYLAKLGADAVVYSAKYFIQRDFVFRATATHIATPESGRSGSPAAPESIPPTPTPLPK